MNSLKVVERNIPDYNDDVGYADGYIILCANVNGVIQHFKIKAHQNSDGYTTYELNDIKLANKKTKTITIWE